MRARPQNAADLDARYREALRLIDAGRWDEARAMLTRLAMEAPKSPEIPVQLARLAGYAGDTAARIRFTDRALALKPSEPALLDAAIAAHSVAGDHGAVLALHDRRIAVAKTPLHAATDKALYLQHTGRFAEAEELVRDLIDRNPCEGVLYRTLYATLRVSEDDPTLPRLERLLARSDAPDQSRLNAHFAMAKALEDMGRHGEVFANLDTANDLQGAAAPYDHAATLREHAAFRAAQADADLSPLPGMSDPRPVFVIGPPRSGTTLAERILGAHPGVTAGGELAHALKLVWQGFVKGDKVAPLRELRPPALQALGRNYLARVRADTGAARGVVTDKSIQSHLCIGFLARALPGARFVSIRRDPRDTALSIYKNHFRTGTHRYSTDLRDIALSIQAHRDSMAFWAERLPDRLIEITYEDLVSDPGTTAPKLAAAAGLDFAPESLDFHRSESTVRTLSVAQARAPLHAGRKEAWRRYETELQPFIDAWGDRPWD
ncbi:sulfotransferase [Roseivivax halodurans JCM 10272]|uniref:Sulfotransferase n=1 Tax=Roseivivax halodurans JCM 10272 TaxID=1449350 RepID=X7EJT4_9RHOB|nr:sulfotransferase [Roseivivax halodurans]ETX15406.1 sulfotransferase [Roseivivax halodurans JCM 10272]